MIAAIAHVCAAGLVVRCPEGYWQVTAWLYGDPVYVFPGNPYLEAGYAGPIELEVWPTASGYYTLTAEVGGACDVDMDGDNGTEADIEAFFSALACADGGCAAAADWDNDGTPGTPADIEAFFRSL